jgi:DNA-binding NtrC family response regulator
MTMEPPRAAQAICVAVIEDDPANRAVIVDILEDAGYRVVAWDGHDDVVAFLSQTGADLVIQDIRLGTTHSIWSLLERVNAQPPPAPRVVLCSADRVFLHTNRLALEARSCAIVEKPFDVETLLETVAACLAS